jgi:DNA-directed RNA polymerase specialized sigma24 family protein
MNEREWLTDRFEEHCRRGRALAYRILRTLSEADDAVLAVWLRLHRGDVSEVHDLDPRLLEQIDLAILDADGAR